MTRGRPMPLELISEDVGEEGAQLTSIDNRGDKRKGKAKGRVSQPQQPPGLKRS